MRRKFPTVFRSLFLAFICLIAMTGTVAQAQTPTDTIWVIETTDGNTYTGEILELGSTHLRIRTGIGELSLLRASVKSMKRLDSGMLKNGEYWPENPHASRHFWGPSGYGLRKGEGYYQNTWILFNQASYAFSDHFTIGAGLIPLFFFGVSSGIPVWVTPKFSFAYPNGKGSFGAGTILGGLIGEDTEGIGILYGVNTFGTRERQITIGLGYGYGTESGFSDYPTFSLSGMTRTGRKWAFLSENYFISTGDEFAGMISAGARYMGSQIAVDFGGFIPLFPEMDVVVMLPWLSIAVPFK